MPLTRTLLDCRIDLANQAGIETDAVGGSIPRHSTTELNRFLNQAHRSLRSFVTQLHYNLYKLQTAAAALPTTAPIAGETYGEIPWPTDALQVLGVDVLVTTEVGWRTLEPVDWEERRRFDPEPFFASNQVNPYAFSAISEGTVSTTTLTAGKLAIFPLPSGGQYKIWYLPHWVDITTDTHLFLAADEDWFQWMYWEATRRVATRDNDSQNRLAEANDQLNPIGPNGKANMRTVAGRIWAQAPRKVAAGTKTWRRALDY